MPSKTPKNQESRVKKEPIPVPPKKRGSNPTKPHQTKPHPTKPHPTSSDTDTDTPQPKTVPPKKRKLKSQTVDLKTIAKIKTTKTTKQSNLDTCPKCGRTYMPSTLQKNGGICYKCIKRHRCTKCKDGKHIEQLQSHISVLNNQIRELDFQFDAQWSSLFQNSMTLLQDVNPSLVSLLPVNRLVQVSHPRVVLQTTVNRSTPQNPILYPVLQSMSPLEPLFIIQHETEDIDVVN